MTPNAQPTQTRAAAIAAAVLAAMIQSTRDFVLNDTDATSRVLHSGLGGDVRPWWGEGMTDNTVCGCTGCDYCDSRVSTRCIDRVFRSGLCDGCWLFDDRRFDDQVGLDPHD